MLCNSTTGASCPASAVFLAFSKLRLREEAVRRTRGERDFKNRGKVGRAVKK